MKLFVNERNEIKDVNTTTDESLKLVEVNDEFNPFAGWSIAKICCFKVEVSDDGTIIMFTPYVDTKIIEHVDRLAAQDVAQENALTNIEMAVVGLYELYGGSEA